MVPSPVQDADREHARLSALRRYAILDSGPEPVFDELVARAARESGYPTALLTLMDAERCWFKAATGLHAKDRGMCELPRDQTFCNHAFPSSGTLVVPDALADARFARLDVVNCADGYRAYAGAQLITPDGHSIGTLCVLDTVPREPSREQLSALRALAVQAMALLEVRQRDLGPAPPVAVAEPAPAARLTVLVVDDESIVRQFVDLVLQRRGFRVLHAEHGAEALKIYRANAADVGLVFTDINMPEMDGFALIRALQQEPNPPAIAVMSGRLDRLMRVHLTELGIECVLAKPFTLGEIDRVLALVRR